MVSEFDFKGIFDDEKNIITERELQYAIVFMYECGLKMGRFKKKSQDEAIDFGIEMSDVLLKNIEFNKAEKQQKI